jgi:hypothetical protein
MLIATKFSLGRVKEEVTSAAIPPLYVLSRHRLAIDEAGFEALLCMCLNVGKKYFLKFYVYFSSGLGLFPKFFFKWYIQIWAVLCLPS